MYLNNSKYILFSLVIAGLFLIGLMLFLTAPLESARADPVNLFVIPEGSGDCTQVSPCDLFTALNLANDQDALYLAGGRYTGSGQAVVTLTQSINLLGGWDGTPAGSIMRDPDIYPTTLDGESQRRVIFISELITPVIDGFIITGGNATGLGGGPFTDSEAGGGIYSLDASPIIQNNVITNNIASTLPDIRALGGGIFIKGDQGLAIIHSNQILSNTAGIGIEQGDGGGLFINSPADVQENVFRDNSACENCNRPNGGGAYVGWTTEQIVVAHNHFENNRARWGGGLDVVWSAVRVNNNTFIGNTATQNGAGLYFYYDMGSTIEANRIISNTATGLAGGIGIYITQAPGPTILTNNLIARNQSGASGAGVYAYSDWNVSAITLTHNTLVDNGIGVSVGNHMTATLVNNIVLGHTLGLTVTSPDGNMFVGHTLFWDNIDDGIRGTNPVDADPVFVAPAINDFHISFLSGALDQGVDVGVFTDMDGDSRPAGVGYDIGADEFWYGFYLPLTLK